MKLLPQSAFNRSRDFLATQSRLLEQRLYEFHFEPQRGAQDRVMQALTTYQNSDGGFGNGLEPDVRMQDSSVVATKFALQILQDIRVPMTCELVQEGIDYLLQAYNPQTGVWPLVTEAVMQAPHAPWWDFAGLDKEFGSFMANPKAGILRLLLAYGDRVPQPLIEEVTTTVMDYFDRLPVAMAFFDAISYLLLLQADALESAYRDKLMAKLKGTAMAIVSTDPEAWSGFAIKPLWLAPSPTAPLAKTLGDAVQKNLDYEIQHQNPDGSWSPSWSWGGSYPQSWLIAKKEWQGILTLATLRSLRDYGRIEDRPPMLEEYKYPID